MSQHIDAQGRFQSDRHPDLAPDKIVVSFKDPRARRALWALALDYMEIGDGLGDDIQERLLSLGPLKEASDG